MIKLALKFAKPIAVTAAAFIGLTSAFVVPAQRFGAQMVQAYYQDHPGELKGRFQGVSG